MLVEIEVQMTLLAVIYTIRINLMADTSYHGASGEGNGLAPDNPYRAASDSFSSSESERRHRCEQCTPLHYPFEQSMIVMNNLLIDLLHYQ